MSYLQDVFTYYYANCTHVKSVTYCNDTEEKIGWVRLVDWISSGDMIWGGPLSGSTSPGTSWWSPSSSPALWWSAATPPSYTPSGGPPTTWSSWLTGHKSCGVNVWQSRPVSPIIMFFCPTVSCNVENRWHHDDTYICRRLTVWCIFYSYFPSPVHSSEKFYHLE